MRCWSSYIVEGKLMEVINHTPNMAGRARAQLWPGDITSMWVLGEVTDGRDGVGNELPMRK